MSTLAKYEVILIKKFTIYPYTISNLGITNTKKLHGNKIYETKGIKNKLKSIDKKLTSDEILITIGKLIKVEVNEIKILLYKKLFIPFLFFSFVLIIKIPKTIMYESKKL